MISDKNGVLMDPLAKHFDEVAAHIIIASTKTILLVSPEKPDPDSVSSMFAFREYLRWLIGRRGKTFQCRLFAPEPLAKNSLYEFIKPLGDPYALITTTLPVSRIDICVIFDYGDIRRTHTLPLAERIAEHKTFFIGLDHHPSRGGFPSHGLEIIDEHAPSTTALLYRFFKREKFPIRAEVATCLFAGLAADTKQFSNSLTNAEAHATGAALIRLGARHREIASTMQPRITLTRFRAHLRILPLAHIDEENGFCFFAFSRDDLRRWNATEKDFLSLRKTLESIEEITTAVVYYEPPEGGWYGSIRTKPTASVFAEAIAAQFGGGGHEHEAGFTSTKTAEEIKTTITELIRKTKTA